MARLPESKINEVRQSVDIVDVIGQYLPLTKKGRNYMAICPFHDDTHPSLSISPQKQIYMCFVCHNGGNVFTFLQEHLHISYIEAVKQVAEIGHVDLSEYHLDAPKQVDTKFQSLYDIHTLVQSIYHYYLNTRDAILAKDYLNQRGFNEDIIETFGIGYAPGKPIIYSSLKKREFTDKDIEKSGLVLENGHYDRFKDRIMFPIHDNEGRVVGFSGRIYREGDTNAKYMNSPESDIFVKSRILYNYHRARTSVRKEGFLYILEGFMDVIAMYKAGHENCVALMGTALTKDHVRMIQQLSRHVVICLDGDDAGLSAAKKTSDILTAQGIDVHLIILPDGRDPDEIYSKEGKEGLDATLKKTLTPVEFLFQYESNHLNLQNYEDRRRLLQLGIKALQSVDDKIDRAHYIKELSALTQFSEDIIQEQFHEQKETPRIDIVSHVKETQELLDKYDLAERNLLFYMLLHKNVCDMYESKAGYMYNDTYRTIASYIVDYYRYNRHMDVANLIDRMNQNEKLVQTVISISQLDLPQRYEPKAINDYISLIADNAKRLKKEQLREQFHYVLDPKQKSEILQEIIDLDKEEL